MTEERTVFFFSRRGKVYFYKGVARFFLRVDKDRFFYLGEERFFY